jgi:4-hydroxy-3-polyprenylbenzoate decarboxylase
VPEDKVIVVAITGASGSIYGLRSLELLREMGGISTHLILTAAGLRTAQLETGLSHDEIKARADICHSDRDTGAPIASGSFVTHGMLVAPCSIKTLSAIAHSYDANLVTRAADVCLKERRRLVLMLRETPYHLGHIRTMAAVTEMGGIIFPPVPAFYAQLETLDAVVTQSVGRALDFLGFEVKGIKRWGEDVGPV